MLFGGYVPEDWDDNFLVLGKEKGKVLLVLGSTLLGCCILIYMHGANLASLPLSTALGMFGMLAVLAVLIVAACRVLILGDHIVFDGPADQVVRNKRVLGRVSDLKALRYTTRDVTNRSSPGHESLPRYSRSYRLHLDFCSGDSVTLMQSGDIERLNRTAEKVEAIFGVPIDLDAVQPKEGYCPA